MAVLVSNGGGGLTIRPKKGPVGLWGRSVVAFRHSTPLDRGVSGGWSGWPSQRVNWRHGPIAWHRIITEVPGAKRIVPFSPSGFRASWTRGEVDQTCAIFVFYELGCGAKS
ncbi:unnamed protein product [Phytomonas sp. Hart1]|nr:unnamed protein product [Phytomonas sp. Hart1]|eukprot:CCW72063.1 unnamed protein product [Phytomonas sp. isolate Hart1]